MEQNGKLSSGKRTTFIYIVECEDESLYTGITTDVKRRMGEHFTKHKNGAKYTHARLVKNVRMVWEAESYSAAARLEYAIKKLKRADKLLLIEHPADVTDVYCKKLDETYIVRKDYCMPVDALIDQA